MYKVLIVEDDPMVAMINEQYVCRNKNFCVQKTCRNGQEALDYLLGGADNGDCAGSTSSAPVIDLVIMDVFMPYLNGVETLKKIREKKLDCEVIMVTAANDPATLEEAMHLGVIDFLIKTFAYERFQIALEKFIANDQAFRGANQTIDQTYVDSLISSTPVIRPMNNELPKGIQKKTLDMIEDYLKEKKGWVSGDQISEDVGLSCVTVRHYMGYLMETGEVHGEINYETGGRPSMLYRKA